MAGWKALSIGSGSRSLALLLLFGGLFTAMAAHMWSIVILPCFALAEFVRMVRQKRFEPASAIVLIASASPALLYLPLIARVRDIQHGGSVYHGSLASSYVLAMWPLAFVLIAAIPIVMLCRKIAKGSGELVPAFARTLRMDESVLLFALLANPLVIYFAANITGSPFMYRYGIWSCLSGAILLALLLDRMAGANPRAAFGVFAVSVGVLGSQWAAPHPSPEPVPAYFSSLDSSHGKDDAIVFGSGLHFMQASYYASPELSRRFVYATDREKAIRHRKTDGVDAAFVLGQCYFNVAGRIVNTKRCDESTRLSGSIAPRATN